MNERYELHTGDSLAILPTLPENSVDAIVTDPPYGLGFMGLKWDRSGIANNPELWRAALRVLKPGGHMLAFGGTRTFHRMTCAIEDAGFEVRDVLSWLYGSGFSKSHNLDGEWAGWGTALKPAWEPIILARKPLIGTIAANVAQYCVGALNIDASRVAGAKGSGNWAGVGGTAGELDGGGFTKEERSEQNSLGRFPANLIHDGSPEVVALFPAEAGAFAPVRGTEPSRPAKNCYGEFARGGGAFHGDSGSAARFFYCAKATRADRDEGCDAFRTRPLNWSSGTQSPGTLQSPNTDRSARNFHPTVKPVSLMRYLVRLVTPAGGTVLDPFTGSGSTGKAAMLEGFHFLGIEMNPEYVEIARARIEYAINADPQQMALPLEN